jgi:hypothetical protein
MIQLSITTPQDYGQRNLWGVFGVPHQIGYRTFIFIDMRFSYRASIVEIVTLFFEQFSPLSIVKFVSTIFLSVVNAGCLGIGRAVCSLPIIETTSSMVGRSFGLSWTQRRPMLMNLNGIELEEGYPFVGSINSKPRSSIHNSQA